MHMILDGIFRNNQLAGNFMIAFANDRLNAVGLLKGICVGLSLMFNGHLDTSLTGTAEDLRLNPTLGPEDYPVARLEDGRIFGLGIENMKGGVAAFMMAGKAIKESGVGVKGDLYLAGVCGEIGRASIDS